MTKQEALEELDSLCIPRDGKQDRLADALEAQDPHKCPYCSGVFPIKFKYCPECGWYVRDNVKGEDEA